MKSILKTVRNDVLLLAFSIVLILSFRDLEKTKSYAAGAGGYPTPTPIAYLVPSAYGTIQAAINAASDGGEVVVSPGTYQENINLAGKNILVRSTDPDDSSIVETTIIDGDNAGAVVSFGGDEDFTAGVKGFKIINGQKEEGAAFSGDYSIASIENNIIMTNLANDGGGETSYGAILYRCSGIIENNIIFDNSGRVFYECGGILRNNKIYSNYANYTDTQYGGVIEYSDSIIMNNLIYSNVGGAVVHCDGKILNNSICKNLAETIYSGGISYCDGVLMNNIIWGNSSYNTALQQVISATRVNQYNCIQNWTWGGVGNISSDPGFINYASDNYDLAAGSGCIDAGGRIPFLFEDYDYDTRPITSSGTGGDGSDYDIGAYEYGN